MSFRIKMYAYGVFCFNNAVHVFSYPIMKALSRLSNISHGLMTMMLSLCNLIKVVKAMVSSSDMFGLILLGLVPVNSLFEVNISFIGNKLVFPFMLIFLWLNWNESLILFGFTATKFIWQRWKTFFFQNCFAFSIVTYVKSRLEILTLWTGK